jgi:hypothetical protein
MGSNLSGATTFRKMARGVARELIGEQTGGRRKHEAAGRSPPVAGTGAIGPWHQLGRDTHLLATPLGRLFYEFLEWAYHQYSMVMDGN